MIRFCTRHVPSVSAALPSTIVRQRFDTLDATSELAVSSPSKPRQLTELLRDGGDTAEDLVQ
jgi:hypothetical protein